MPNSNTHTRRFQCRHVFTGGHRCGSPCLTGEDFCFYHRGLHARQAVPTVDLSQGEHRATPSPSPPRKTAPAIQQAIGEVLNRLAANELDPRRAGLLLYGLQIASLNLPRPAVQLEQETTVEEIVTDPDLGTVAPRAKLLSKDTPRPNSLTSRLLEAIRLGRAEAEPSTIQELEPVTLPNLNAAAEPTIPETLTAPVAPQIRREIARCAVSKSRNTGSGKAARTPAERLP
jgi:hypothetical protein